MVIWTNCNINERIFSPLVNDDELVWHRDYESRYVEVLESCDGWYFQRENDLPRLLIVGDVFHIQLGEWHRLYKKSPLSDLIIKITKTQ